MRKLIIIALISTSLPAFSQDFDKVYYNDKWEMTSMKFASYYRSSGFDRESLTFDSIVVDHYMDGSTEMTGTYSEGIKDGEFLYYYPDGSVKHITGYDRNRRSGLWTSYFENGQINKIVEYRNGKERLLKYSDNQGNSILNNLTGTYSSEFYYNYSYNYSAFSEAATGEGSVKYNLNGRIKDGFKDGEWVVSYFRNVSTKTGENEWVRSESSVPLLRLKFKMGEFIGGYHFPSSGSKVEIFSDTLTFLMLEPVKIPVTESLRSEPGQMIRHNYVIKAVLDKEKESKENAIPDDESGIMDFFDSNFSVYAINCSDTARITIKLKFDDQNKVLLSSIEPKVKPVYEKEVIRIISMIAKVKTHTGPGYDFIFRIPCLDELEFKR